MRGDADLGGSCGDSGSDEDKCERGDVRSSEGAALGTRDRDGKREKAGDDGLGVLGAVPLGVDGAESAFLPLRRAHNAIGEKNVLRRASGAVRAPAATMDVQPEELDLTALLSSGRVTAKRHTGAPTSPRPQPRPPPAAAAAPAHRMDPAELIDDTSSWSESDEDEAAPAPAPAPEPAEASDSDEREEGRTLHDPLGLLGELTATMRYDARLDPGSVRFDAAALLSTVHYATSFDKLRQGLEALRAQLAASAPHQARGVIDSDNFQRFAATARCVETLLHSDASRVRAQLPAVAGQGSAAAREALQSAVTAVLQHRAALQRSLRLARFARRYHSVLALPQLVRRLAAADDAGAVVREWRRAQRVLRGTQGPLFRCVLTELDEVAETWKASLMTRLAQPYYLGDTGEGEAAPSAGDAGSADGGAEAPAKAAATAERWAQRVEGACRALKELGVQTDPWAHFARAQCRNVQWTRLDAVTRLLPALRVAHSPLGGGVAAWAQLLAGGAEQLQRTLAPTAATLRDALRVQAAVARACGADSGPAVALLQLTLSLRRGLARTVLDEARARCLDPNAREQWAQVRLDAGAALRGVLEPALVEEAQRALLHCALDTLVRTWVDDAVRRTPEGLLQARTAALVLGGEDTLARGAAARAETVLVELHARALRELVARAVGELVRDGDAVDDEGVSQQLEWVAHEAPASSLLAASSSAPALTAQTCACRLCDWVLEVLRYLAGVRTTTAAAGVDAAPLLVACTERVFVVLDDAVARERELLLAHPGLTARVLFDAAFLREALRPFVSRLADGRFRQLFLALGRRTTAHLDEELTRYHALVQCFRDARAQ